MDSVSVRRLRDPPIGREAIQANAYAVLMVNEHIFEHPNRS